jgi:hypothetical protein
VPPEGYLYHRMISIDLAAAQGCGYQERLCMGEIGGVREYSSEYVDAAGGTTPKTLCSTLC